MCLFISSSDWSVHLTVRVKSTELFFGSDCSFRNSLTILLKRLGLHSTFCLFPVDAIDEILQQNIQLSSFANHRDELTHSHSPEAPRIVA